MSLVYVTQLAVEVLSTFGESPVSGGVSTVRFDAGTGTAWYCVPQVTDSGIDLRDKCVKPVHVTGKLTNASFKIYGYGPSEAIDVSAIEAGTGSKTGAKSLPDSTQVVQSPRKPINVANCMLHTIRVEGDCTGETIMDRIDEIVYEVAQQGIRR